MELYWRKVTNRLVGCELTEVWTGLAGRSWLELVSEPGRGQMAGTGQRLSPLDATKFPTPWAAKTVLGRTRGLTVVIIVAWFIAAVFCLFGFLTSLSATRLYIAGESQDYVWHWYVLPHKIKGGEAMTFFPARPPISTVTQKGEGGERKSRKANNPFLLLAVVIWWVLNLMCPQNYLMSSHSEFQAFSPLHMPTTGLFLSPQESCKLNSIRFCMLVFFLLNPIFTTILFSLLIARYSASNFWGIFPAGGYKENAVCIMLKKFAKKAR